MAELRLGLPGMRPGGIPDEPTGGEAAHHVGQAHEGHGERPIRLSDWCALSRKEYPSSRP